MNFIGSTVGEWTVSNLLWGLISGIFIFLAYERVWPFMRAIQISKTILIDNRDTRDNGWGKYATDRYIDIWYANEQKTPLVFEVGRFYSKTFNNPNSRHWMDVIDRQLVALGLVEIFESPKGYKAVKPIRSWRNKIVKSATQFYLVHFIGDNPKYYKDREEQWKRSL